MDEDNTTIVTSSETISSVYSICREICCNYVESFLKSKQIGGPGMTVQIDESKFGKRKYSRGRLVEGQWVLGGICQESGDMFLEIVQKRDKNTLMPIILKCVAKGSTIITDCWRAYSDLKDEYKHLTVNHSLNFVGMY